MGIGNGISRAGIFTAGLSVSIVLLCLLMSGSDHEKKTSPGQLEFSVSDYSDFRRLKEAKPGDWRYEYHETEQSFHDYIRSHPVRAHGGRRVLVFQPVGPFPADKRKFVGEAVKFAAIWFDLEARISPDLPLPVRGYNRTKKFPWQTEPQPQYRTDYFLELLLPDMMPKDAIAYLAVTMVDLYPEDSWNYLFGQASFINRVGVYSIVRYFPEFWGLPANSVSRELAQKRICRVLVHEAGHIFGLRHCRTYACAMNGSNSLEESDLRPLRLCPSCLKKLQLNRNFDVIDRYEKLLKFYNDHGFKEDAEWTEKRLDKIKKRK